VKRSLSQISCWLVLGLNLSSAQSNKKPSPDEGMVLPPIAVDKKKTKENIQVPPKQIELPAAVTADADRIAFELAPVSARGLLSQQTREALRAMLRANRGATVVKLRAFVSGSGDLRRIGEIVGEVFTERHQPLPALTVVQVGALPREGEQVLIESTEVERTAVNPNGLAFVSGQAGDNLGQALERVKAAVRVTGGVASDVLRVSCFVSSLEQENASLPGVAAEFPQAATLVVQMQRGPVRPGAECEAVARLHTIPKEPLEFLDSAEPGAAKNYSEIALVGPGKLVFTAAQLGFGTQASDIRLAFERLGRVLASFQTGFQRLVVSCAYLTNLALAPKIREVRSGFYTAQKQPASTFLPFEGLPSIDGSFAIDLIAVSP